MAWVRFDDATADHPKLSALGNYAPLCGWLWFSSCCYAMRHLTDGRIDSPTLRRLWPFGSVAVGTAGVGDGAGTTLIKAMDDPHVEDLVSLLVTAELLDEISPDVYQIHDFLDYNPSRREVLQARRVKAKSGRAGGQASAQARAQASARRLLEEESNPPSPSPSPSPKLQTNLRPAHAAGLPLAREILDFLNRKAGRAYRPSESNLALIRGRLADGIEPWQLKAIVSRKVREWAGDPKMAKYLRPATLFNATKCEQYIGELPAHQEIPDGDE